MKDHMIDLLKKTLSAVVALIVATIATLAWFDNRYVPRQEYTPAVTSLNVRLDRVDVRLDRMEGKVDEIGTHLAALDGKISYMIQVTEAIGDDSHARTAYRR